VKFGINMWKVNLSLINSVEQSPSWGVDSC